MDYEEVEDAEPEHPDNITESEWAKRMGKQRERWATAHPMLCQLAVQNAPLQAHLAARRQKQRQQELEELLDLSQQFHACSAQPRAHADGHAEAQPLRQPLQRKGYRDAVYYSMNHRFAIKVPLFYCSCCKVDVEPRPQDVGCWPSTVTVPFIWYDLELMHTYTYLGLRQGLSATGGWLQCDIGGVAADYSCSK